MAIWNSRDVNPPPWVTLPVEKALAKNDIYKSTWRLLHSTAEYFLKHMPFLYTELQLLEKIIYKQNKTMRREKLMFYLKQMKKCLTRFQEVDLAKVINNIADAWPSPDDVRIAGSHVYLPSRQQIDYTVVRIVGVAHLLQQAANYALLAFDKAMLQIHIGMIVHSMLVFCATTSRLWFLCHSFRKHLNPLYEQLKAAATKLEATKVEWVDLTELPRSILFGDFDEFAELETKMKNKKSHVDKLLEKFDFTDNATEETSLTSFQGESEGDRSSTEEDEDVGMIVKRSGKSEDFGIPINRKVTSETVSKKLATDKTDTPDMLGDASLEEVMNTPNIESIYEEDDNYRQPVATSTPAANHPHFGGHLKNGPTPLLKDLTEIIEDDEETFDASIDYNLKKLRLKIKKCKSIPKLLVIITNNKSTIESKGEGKFQLCERNIRKFRKKAKEEVDLKERLLKRAKNMLEKELGLELDQESNDQGKKNISKVKKNLFAVPSKKELKLVISDASKRQLGIKKILERLLQNRGKFKVAGKVYKMSPGSLDKFSGVVKKLSLKKSSRTNAPILVNRLVSIFKHEIASDSSQDGSLKVKKRSKLEDTKQEQNLSECSEVPSRRKKGGKRKAKNRTENTS